MKESAVVDSSCLIGLERIGRLDLLPALYDPIIAPPEVAHEFGTPLPWLHIESPNNQALVTALRVNLDKGESEAIALAYERDLLVILDDLPARSIAKSIGLKIIGLVGVLVRAKWDGLIPELKPLLIMLEANQFRLSQRIK